YPATDLGAIPRMGKRAPGRAEGWRPRGVVDPLAIRPAPNQAPDHGTVRPNLSLRRDRIPGALALEGRHHAGAGELAVRGRAARDLRGVRVGRALQRAGELANPEPAPRQLCRVSRH